ncbi:BREX system P-loop protein BrxC [Deltaproteobacteria bacterium TL4]
MNNRDIYLKDPTLRKLVNEGVASVNDLNEHVLRYELETFVCSGQYQKGISHILRTYMDNIRASQQPGVWVSGFYGSGKSHLVKMLSALWTDYHFEDGAKARGIAMLPQDVRDLLVELEKEGKRHGGLHSISGTLKANDDSNSVRSAILAMVFKSIGLPAKYHLASFVMWLQEEGLLKEVRQIVEGKGKAWEEEITRLHVSKIIREALVQLKPQIFFDERSCAEILRNQFPSGKDVSSDDMLKAMRLALTRNGKLPLTLMVLDEVQQYIGEDSQRSIDVQEAVEACCKNLGSKILFIGTGQTAVTGTSNLKKLEGRFTIRVELSDTDVDSVIRQVILAKKPEAKEPIETIMQTNLGEISRHLSGTTLGHRQEDIAWFPQDYPILPVRRRFWENTLRVLDRTGTDSQLRNQLSMIHKVIQTNLNAPLGQVIPADYLYFDSAEKLLQSRILPRKVYEKTMSWIKGSEAEQLMARACGLVFLINKLSGSNTEIGIRCTIHSLADLMVENLASGSGSLRAKLPALLDQCELLMKVGEEYRIQTEESSAWNDEFLSQRSILANETHRIESERDDRIRKKFGEIVKNLSLTQGTSKVTRTLFPHFDAQLPTDADKKIYVWVRDGWHIDENSVRIDARQAGNQSPTVFIFIPKRSADDLRHHLIDYKAAIATLDKRGVPNTPEGIEARSAMETTRQTAETKIRELLEESFSGARVFQGGGNEIPGDHLQEMVLDAANNSLQRLYPNFYWADHLGWAKVYEKAQKGAPDALKAVGDEGEPAKNPICKAILGFISGGKRGTDIRNGFEGETYGWSRDAVDGALQVLLVAGILRAQDERGQTVDPKELERKSIGKTTFKVESTTLTTIQRIAIRKLLQKAGLQPQQGEELVSVPRFLQKMLDLAEQAGGEAPQPLRPDSSLLEEIRLLSGNEQLLAVYNNREPLAQFFDAWTHLAERIQQRWTNWIILQKLLKHVSQEQPLEELESTKHTNDTKNKIDKKQPLASLIRVHSRSFAVPDMQILFTRIQTLEQQRQLLAEPDWIIPLVNNLSQLLREELNRFHQQYTQLHQQGMTRLHTDGNWQKLEPEQRNQLLQEQKLTLSDAPVIQVSNTQEILNTLEKISLSALSDRIAAMNSRFEAVLTGAAELMEPKAQFIKLPGRTLKTSAEMDSWLNEVKQQLLTALQQGPVVIR